jgi:glycosyltransferase involved in cell wall biosynthesis
MNDPKVSVIIPTRNRSRQLRLALRSALAQRDVDLEVLVIDDGSTDDTQATVSNVPDPRVRYLKRAASEGVSAARNAGIADARGRWIAFLDDDDVWAPTKVARQVDVMEANGRAWSYAGDVTVDSELRILAGAPPPPPDEVVRLLERHDSVPAGASNVIVHADALSAAGPFDPALTNNEDWDMWIRLGRGGPPDWVCNPMVAISYHGDNASRNMVAMIRQLDVVATRYGIQVDRARHYRWAAWQALLEQHRADAIRYYGRAVLAGDIKSLARAGVALFRPNHAISLAGSKDPIAEQDPWIAEARAWLDTLSGAIGPASDQI